MTDPAHGLPALIADRFSFRGAKPLGRGGMGEVFKGLDGLTGQPVAIKVLKPELLDRQRLRARFESEAEALRKLDHPNIVKLVASERDDSGRHYLIMEYMPGGSLRQALDQRGQMPVRETARIGLQLCDALARVHFLDIVHRDIKPDNVLLDADGTPRLTDFGIAHLADKSRITERGDVIGTLPYLSPEACNGDVLDARTDIWSLGVMLYEMLAGQRPFVGETPAALVAAITSRALAPVRTHRPNTPPRLENLLEKMLVKNRQRRLPNVHHAGAALTELLKTLASEPSPAVEAADSAAGAASDSQTALLSTLNHDQQAERPASAEGLSPALSSTIPSSLSSALSSGGEPLAPPSPERKSLLILLDKVKRFWVKGLLDKTVGADERLRLRHRPCPELVKRPWEQVADHMASQVSSQPGERSTGEDRPEAHAQTTTFDAFQEADRSLLILGEPGCGKTTTLLRLARQLIARAERDPEQPIPVVLNLSSWAESRGPLAEWIVLELTAKYQIPRHLGRHWLAANQLLLLLDELDGAQRTDKEACIQAINEFREEHGLMGLVVCGRRADYEASNVRLELGGAFVIEPLARDQLAAVLARDDNAHLRAVLERDAALRELAQSPLMLDILRRVYAPEDSAGDGEVQTPVAALTDEPAQSLPERREQLFAAYVARMNRRVSPGQKSAPAARAQTQLSWLARQMLAHNQATFLIEQMQPSWLPGNAWRWLYLILTRMIFGCIIGATWGWMSASAGYHSQLYTAVQNHFALSMIPANILTIGGLGVLSGLSVAMVEGLLFTIRTGRPDEARILLGRGRRDDVLLVAVAILVAVAVHATFASLSSGFFLDGMALGMFLLLTLAHHECSQSWRTDLRVVEALGWSWRRAFRWSWLGFIFTSAASALAVWQFDTNLALHLLGSGVLFFFLLGGLRGHRPETWDSPNQGIRLSLRNAPLAWLILGAPIGIYYDQLFGVAGLASFVTIGALGSLVYALADIIKHGCLRLLLWASSPAPLGVIGFLEDASARALMRRVGGGYIFMHRHMIDYFAALPDGRVQDASPRGTNRDERE